MQKRSFGRKGLLIALGYTNDNAVRTDIGLFVGSACLGIIMIRFVVKPRLRLFFLFFFLEDTEKFPENIHNRPPIIFLHFNFITQSYKCQDLSAKSTPAQLCKGAILYCFFVILKNYFRAACAAASLAIGTRKGEQET